MLIISRQFRGGGAFVTDGSGTPVPLSPPQRRLWLELAKHGAANQDATLLSALALQLSGPVRPELLRLACADVVARHPALRTRLTDSESGLPQQGFWADAAEAFGWSAAGEARAVDDIARRVLAEPLPLINAPMSAATLAPLPQPGEWAFVWVFHHLIVDGWSLDIIARDLGAAYAARAMGNPALAPRSPQRYLGLLEQSTADETTAAHQENLAYWRQLLSADDQGAAKPVTGSGVRTAGFDLDHRQCAALDTVAGAATASPMIGLLALYTLVLSRWFGSAAPLVAMPVLGRTEASEGAVGCFANVLPIGCQVDERQSYRELLERLADRFFDAMDRPVQFDLIMGVAGSKVRFAAVPGPAGGSAPETWHDITARPVHGTVGTKAHFELVLQIESGPGRTRLILLGDAGHWRVDELAVFRDELRDVAAQCLQRPDDPVVAIGGRSVAASLPRFIPPAPPRGVAGFLELFARRGDRPAVSCDGEVWTYRQLADAGVWLADRLAERGIGAGDRVAVVLGRGPWQVAAAVGIMAAGAVYMPCDPASVGRTKAALAVTPHALVVTEDAHRELVGAVGVLELEVPPREAVPVSSQLTGPAYVIHTSGSTGRPRAVEVSHETLAGTIADGIAAGELSEHDVVSTHCSPSFDASLWEWLPILAVGGRLALMPDEVKTDLVRVWRWAADEGVTVTLLTTSLLMQAVTEAPVSHPTLRLLQTGAEAMTGRPPAVPCPIMNVYGPTEGGITATAGLLCDERPHIGTVLPNATVYLLDEWLRPVRPGGVGQIFIAGGREANGYADAPGMTARAFVPDPYGKPGGRMYATGDYAWLEPDGVVMYRGRRDDQVKIRGVRIELGEVETAIETHPDVRAACAVTANRTLHAFYTGVPIPARNLREYLRSRLPTAALPATLTHLDRMPISVNGKADRRALAALAEAGPEPEPASASLTEGIAGVIAQFWSDALGQPHLGASADFFELGGDSLVAARLCARISGRLNVHVPLVTVFQAPVLADFIEACVAAQGKAGPKL